MKQFVNEYDEALDALTNGMLDTSDIEPYMDTIVAALKKQIPEKPTRLKYQPLIDAGWEWECPNCKCACGNNKYFPIDDICCGQCGQLLNWGDV